MRRRSMCCSVGIIIERGRSLGELIGWPVGQRSQREARLTRGSEAQRGMRVSSMEYRGEASFRVAGGGLGEPRPTQPLTTGAEVQKVGAAESRSEHRLTLIDSTQCCLIVTQASVDMVSACLFSAYRNGVALGRPLVWLKSFLPVGMLDSVPRPHSPPRVTIRGVFLLRGRWHEPSRRNFRGWLQSVPQRRQGRTRDGR